MIQFLHFSDKTWWKGRRTKYNRQISLTRQRAFMLSHLTSKGEATESIKTDFSLYQIQVARIYDYICKIWTHSYESFTFDRTTIHSHPPGCRKETSILPLLRSVEELIPMYADSASVLLDSIQAPDELTDKDFAHWCMLCGKVTDEAATGLLLSTNGNGHNNGSPNTARQKNRRK